jgi:hypothetical protein
MSGLANMSGTWDLRLRVSRPLEPKCNMVVIEDYNHVKIITNENVDWMKLTYQLSSFPLNLRIPFYKSTFTSKFLIPLLDVIPLPCIYFIWYEESTCGTSSNLQFSTTYF